MPVAQRAIVPPATLCLTAGFLAHMYLGLSWAATAPSLWHALNCLRDFWLGTSIGIVSLSLEHTGQILTFKVILCCIRKEHLLSFVQSIGRLFVHRVTDSVSQLRVTVRVEETLVLLQYVSGKHLRLHRVGLYRYSFCERGQEVYLCWMKTLIFPKPKLQKHLRRERFCTVGLCFPLLSPDFATG